MENKIIDATTHKRRLFWLGGEDGLILISGGDKPSSHIPTTSKGEKDLYSGQSAFVIKTKVKKIDL
jgi:hypothetical protein